MTIAHHPNPAADHFDLVIIGSGSGNSIPEYLAGWKIAMVERGTFGGTCLNVGCIPSKMFVLPADHALAASQSDLNLSTTYAGVDWLALRDRIFGRIDSISAGGREYRATGTDGLTLFAGTASFSADRAFSIRMNDGTDDVTITGERVLLASGSRAYFPAIEGLDKVGAHTSDTIMRLDALPERLGILGAGYIAAEMGHVFSALGSEVTMYNRSAVMLRAQDGDVAARFTEQFRHRVNYRAEDVPVKIERGANGIEITSANGDQVVVDELLVAIGRKPNADLLNAQAGGVELTPDGRVHANEAQETSAAGVWAVGDVSNRFQLKHLANAEAKTAYWNIAQSRNGGSDIHTVDYSAVPAAVFSNPQVASVGLTEEELVASGIPFFVGRRDYGGTAYGWALDDHHSFAKVLIDPEGLILGAHIIGPQAASIIQPIVQAKALGQTAQQLANDVFYIHPALTEVIENALIEAITQL